MPSNLMAPPRTHELWDAIVTRIGTTESVVLGGIGRVFVEGDYSGPQWAENAAGGRVVVRPTLPLGGLGGTWLPGQTQTIGFLIRTDFNNYTAPGYNVSRQMSKVQRAVFDLLQGWVPAPFTKAMAAFPVYLVRPWQPWALYDEATGTVYLSAEYRLEMADAP